MRRAISLAKSDMKLSLRRGEALILNLLFPIFFLVAINKTSEDIDKALAFSLVLTTMSTSMSTLGITAGFDRRYRVLVRLGTTPLTKLELVISRVLSVLVLQTFYFSILFSVALLMGWRPVVSWLLVPVMCWVASFSFAGIALIVVSKTKAETNLALQNLLYFLMAGAAASSLSTNLSKPISFVTKLTPAGALHDLIQAAIDIRGFSYFAALSLLTGAVVWPYLASKLFTFDEA